MCMCGAHDCPICYPGNNAIVECDFCGLEMPLWATNDEYHNHEVKHFCDDCFGKIKECYYCNERIHVDNADFANWIPDEYNELTCPKCVAEAKAEGCWYGK